MSRSKLNIVSVFADFNKSSLTDLRGFAATSMFTNIKQLA